MKRVLSIVSFQRRFTLSVSSATNAFGCGFTQLKHARTPRRSEQQTAESTY
jgi:hypothetical protein